MPVPPGRADSGNVTDEEPEEYVTTRAFIKQLIDAAGHLPNGLDSPVELAICDGNDKQYIDRVEVTWQYVYDEETGNLVRQTPDLCTLILGHWHRDESPGRVHRGVPSAVDEELREMTDPGES